MIYRTEKEKAQDIADLRGACEIVRKDIRVLAAAVVRYNEEQRSISEIQLESREMDLRILQKELRAMMATMVTPAIA